MFQEKLNDNLVCIRTEKLGPLYANQWIYYLTDIISLE